MKRIVNKDIYRLHASACFAPKYLPNATHERLHIVCNPRQPLREAFTEDALIRRQIRATLFCSGPKVWARGVRVAF